jgi:hypothetical protein
LPPAPIRRYIEDRDRPRTFDLKQPRCGCRMTYQGGMTP